MFLNIILTILTVTLITMTVLLTIWWRKYGKKMFNSISNASGIMNNPMLKDLTGGSTNLGSMMERINQMKQMMSKMK